MPSVRPPPNIPRKVPQALSRRLRSGSGRIDQAHNLWYKSATMKFNLFKTGVVICLLILLGGSILQTMGGSPNGWGVDDAFIGYRYARNLEAGKGLVFNPGERVEAYTRFSLRGTDGAGLLGNQ